jgi:integrase
MLMEQIDVWLALRRANGFALRGYERHLGRFAEFASLRGEDHVRAATAIEWASQASTPGERHKQLERVILFARYLHAEDASHEIPPGRYLPAPRQRPVPYIYTADESRRLVEAASQLGPAGSLRPHTVRAVIALLFATGLRISEALGLRIDEVLADGLVIRGAKFGKTRLVPLHPSASAGLASYLDRRRAVARGDDPVFVSLLGRRLSHRTFHQAWTEVLRQAGLQAARPAGKPRIHDIRHTFAVRALESAPGGRDRIERHMLAVSTYLGHSCVADTYWYFQATPTLLSQLADACESHFEGEPA